MSSPAQQDGGRKHTAGAYDVRFVIAGLIGLYGVVLVIFGLVAESADDRAKTGGFDVNLWAGVGMIVFAVVFALWARLRPVIVDEEALARARAEQDDRPAH
jgi:hypothetical protein